MIDGTIFPQIDAVHPIESENWNELTSEQQRARREKVEYTRKQNAVAVRLFCRTDVRGTLLEILCG